MSALLAIDTTSRGGSLALAREGTCLGVVDHETARGYAESLFPLLDELLDRVGCAREDVGSLAVVRGPGSFTGLRIGIVMAKTLAFARRLPLWTSDTLPLLASQAVADDPPADAILALLDAGAGAVYAGLHAPDRDLEPLAPARRLLLADVADWARPVASTWTVVAQDAALQERALRALPRAAAQRFTPNRGLARRLAELASAGESPARRVAPATLVPLYLTPSQAERAHGVDLREVVHRAIPPSGWE